MTPLDSRWFSLEPPKAMESEDEIEQWFKRCTEVMQAELSRSNFYTEIHELYLDRGAFGTAAILVEGGKNNSLNFTKLDLDDPDFRNISGLCCATIPRQRVTRYEYCDDSDNQCDIRQNIDFCNPTAV
jgi:hypothetical protein